MGVLGFEPRSTGFAIIGHRLLISSLHSSGAGYNGQVIRYPQHTGRDDASFKCVFVSEQTTDKDDHANMRKKIYTIAAISESIPITMMIHAQSGIGE
jgi:hypothetical protein